MSVRKARAAWSDARVEISRWGPDHRDEEQVRIAFYEAFCAKRSGSQVALADGLNRAARRLLAAIRKQREEETDG